MVADLLLCAKQEEGKNLRLHPSPSSLQNVRCNRCQTLNFIVPFSNKRRVLPPSQIVKNFVTSFPLLLLILLLLFNYNFSTVCVFDDNMAWHELFSSPSFVFGIFSLFSIIILIDFLDASSFLLFN